jgi:hypothetical protein
VRVRISPWALSSIGRKSAEPSNFISDVAKLANGLGVTLAEQRESFIFETVFSDPVGDKVEFLSSDLAKPFRKVAEFRDGKAIDAHEAVPSWVTLPEQ